MTSDDRFNIQTLRNWRPSSAGARLKINRGGSGGGRRTTDSVGLGAWWSDTGRREKGRSAPGLN